MLCVMVDPSWYSGTICEIGTSTAEFVLPACNITNRYHLAQREIKLVSGKIIDCKQQANKCRPCIYSEISLIRSINLLPDFNKTRAVLVFATERKNNVDPRQRSQKKVKNVQLFFTK